MRNWKKKIWRGERQRKKEREGDEVGEILGAAGLGLLINLSSLHINFESRVLNNEAHSAIVL